MTKGSFRRVFALLFTALLVTLVACDSQGATEPASSSEAHTETTEAAARGVRATTASTGVLTTSRSVSITIDPRQESEVAAGTGGQVESIFYREGMQVQAGDVVIKLDDEALRLQANNAAVAVESARVNLQKAERATQEGSGQAASALRTAEANLNLVRKQYNEGQQLFAAGGISATDLAGLETQLAQAEASYQQAQNAVAQSQRAGQEDLQLLRLQVQQAQTQLAQAQKMLSEASITAPFAGEIADVMVEVGEFIGAGSPAFKLVSTDQQLARFSVPVQDANLLLQQDVIYIRYGGLDYAAHIIRSSQVPGQTRLVDITAEIYPSENPIPTGTVTQLNYDLELGEGIKLPSGAVQTSSGTTYVYVVEDNVAKRTPVNVITEAGDEVLISGIDEGQSIIYPVPSDLRDGVRVTIIGGENDS